MHTPVLPYCTAARRFLAEGGMANISLLALHNDNLALRAEVAELKAMVQAALDKTMTAKEVSLCIGVTRDEVYRLPIRKYKAGVNNSHVFYKKSDVDEYLSRYKAIEQKGGEKWE